MGVRRSLDATGLVQNAVVGMLSALLGDCTSPIKPRRSVYQEFLANSHLDQYITASWRDTFNPQVQNTLL